MSATLDNGRLQQLLPDAPMIISEGRTFPVERRYQPLAAHLRFDEAVAIATAELLRHESGSLLLFYRALGKSCACRNNWQRVWAAMLCYVHCTAR